MGKQHERVRTVKHAYLVMAHGSWHILEKLMRLLDADFNDIYLHIDKKATNVPDVSAWLTKSKLTVIEPIDVRWAHYTQTECQFKLLKAACSHGGYSYFHFVSGVDLPIKPVRDIYDYFERSGKNFIPFYQYPKVPRRVKSVRVYHPLVSLHSFRSHKILKGIDRAMEYGQRLIGINRLRHKNLEIQDGWNWCSLQKDFAEYAISKEAEMEKVFRSTIAPEEKVFQTIIWHSEYRQTLADVNDIIKGCLRMIDWQRGTPYVWGQDKDDFEFLMNCDCMFARKFDEKHMEIVNQIFERLSV